MLREPPSASNSSPPLIQAWRRIPLLPLLSPLLSSLLSPSAYTCLEDKDLTESGEESEEESRQSEKKEEVGLEVGNAGSEPEVGGASCR